MGQVRWESGRRPGIWTLSRSPPHTAELPTSPDDASLHQFTCGTPLSAGALTARYQRLATFPARQ